MNYIKKLGQLFKLTWINQSPFLFYINLTKQMNYQQPGLKNTRTYIMLYLLALNLTSQSLGVSRIQHVKMKKALDLTSKNLRLRLRCLICKIKIPPTLQGYCTHQTRSSSKNYKKLLKIIRGSTKMYLRIELQNQSRVFKLRLNCFLAM